MLRLSKIADYGTKIMLAMAIKPNDWVAASELAAATHISLPTVSKILKLLTKGGLLVSQRGSRGGYQLTRTAERINLAEVVKILEGDIAMTECERPMGCCQIEANCDVKGNWSIISDMIAGVLQNISLAQMSRPMRVTEIPLTFHQRADA